MIYNLEIERQFLAGLIKYPESFVEVSSFISEKDFFSENSSVHQTIFSVYKSIIEKKESIDAVVLSERVKSLGISFEDNVNISDYIQSLSLKKINKSSILDIGKELTKLTLRREIYYGGLDLSKKMKSLSPEKDPLEILEESDKLYNDRLHLFQEVENSPKNVFEEMVELVEERGENPIEEFGLMGPHDRINDLYGSLLRPGNITVVCARSGVGKTTFVLDFVRKVCAAEKIPVLHLDNGEMSKEEITMRMCSAMSKVPMHLLESGRWRQAGDQIVSQVRSVWNQISDINLDYYNVGGKSIDEILNVIKKYYYSKVGRGNKMILSFDYIKTTFQQFSNKSEWQVVGEMVDKFKKLIQTELVFDNEPMLSLFTSVQSNRLGITTNRNSDNIVDDESVVSLSDRITQFCSHMFILRHRTNDEIEMSPDFGTHVLIPVKTRHLGKDVHRAINKVRMQNGQLRNNCIFLDVSSFSVEEKGDLKDLIDSMSELSATADGSDNLDSVPDL